MNSFIISVAISLISVSALAQTSTNSCEQDLLRSQLRIGRLQSENDRLRAELATYENPTPVSKGYVCSAACASSDGVPDMRFLEIGSGALEIEADLNAKQAVKKKYTCTFGVKKVECEKILTDNAEARYCIAGCVNSDGNVNDNYLASARGRTLLETKAAALKALGATYKCTFGAKIQACE